MATRKNDQTTPVDPPVEQPTPPPIEPDPPLPQARVRPREYASGPNWQVGDRAPSDAYRRIGQYGEPTGPVTFEHPGGKALRVAVAGVPITEAIYRDLNRGVDTDDEG